MQVVVDVDELDQGSGSDLSYEVRHIETSLRPLVASCPAVMLSPYSSLKPRPFGFDLLDRTALSTRLREATTGVPQGHQRRRHLVVG